MNALLVSLLGVLVLPLFVATWRTSLLGLACQGWLMAWLSFRTHGAAPGTWLTLVDLALVRGVLAPLALYTVLRRQRAPARNDLIPPNLFSWFLALAALLLAYNFSQALAGTQTQQAIAAVTTAAVLLAFLVLATQSGPLSQIVGALQIENAIALFELGESEPAALATRYIQLGQIGVFVLSVGFFRWYLASTHTHTSHAPNAMQDFEGPAL